MVTIFHTTTKKHIPLVTLSKPETMPPYQFLVNCQFTLSEASPYCETWAPGPPIPQGPLSVKYHPATVPKLDHTWTHMHTKCNTHTPQKPIFGYPQPPFPTNTAAILPLFILYTTSLEKQINNIIYKKKKLVNELEWGILLKSCFHMV